MTLAESGEGVVNGMSQIAGHALNEAQNGRAARVSDFDIGNRAWGQPFDPAWTTTLQRLVKHDEVAMTDLSKRGFIHTASGLTIAGPHLHRGGRRG